VRVLEFLAVVLAAPGAVAALGELLARRGHVVRDRARPGRAELDIHVRLRIARGSTRLERHRRR
jgi:hypothetical protein